jgi:anaerobic magnesium-protoporphyrin IX monomethyl ester cyclase
MTPYAPLSTLIAAALLREHGHEVAVFDSTFADGIGRFEDVLARTRPSMVAIMEDNFNFLTKMCTVRRREDAFAMIAAAKHQGCIAVANGPDAIDRPALYLNAGADAVLLGEGEAALLELADHLKSFQNASLDLIPGLALAAPSGVRRTRPRPPQQELDRLPLPAWDMIDAHAYRGAWRARHGRFSWNLATSRGCPYGCNWCAKPVFGRGYELRSPRSVALEMDALRRQIGPDHVWFADDIFGLTADWVEDFAREVRLLGTRLPFTMQSRVNLMDSKMVGALADAGAEEVWLGVESGSQKILDAMDKGSRVEQAREATRLLKSHGIRTCWFIQLGYPGEFWEDLNLTRELIREERPDDIGVSVAYPLPGTRFHDKVRAELGDRSNWVDSDDLAMLFKGAYDTEFYRAVRDVMHDEVRNRQYDDVRWMKLGLEEPKRRSANPVLFAEKL